MPTSTNSFGDISTWWEQLGLHHGGPLSTSGQESGVERAALEVLNAHPPVAFGSAAGGQALTIDQVADLVRQASDHAKTEGDLRRDSDAAERRRFGWERVEEALTRPDADEAVTEGRWVGFTLGEATAWSWNLFQYEPHGFVSPGSQVRREAIERLEAGVLSEVFGYPERARELAGKCLTPREFRQYQEALGAHTFSKADIRRG